jgi:uncharacterized integral membrane protein
VYKQEGQPAPGVTETKEKGLIGGGAILLLILAAALISFIIQNTQDVQIEWLWFDASWPLWLIVLISAVLGAAIWFFAGVLRRHQRRKERRADR